MVKEKLTDTPQLFDWFQKITNINKKKSHMHKYLLIVPQYSVFHSYAR